MERRARQDFVVAVSIVCIVALLAMILAVGATPPGADGSVSPFRGARNWWYAPQDLKSCKSNLKNIGTALEMYSTDTGGRFPTCLTSLTPNYLKVIPTCPAADADTYTCGYRGFS